MGVEQEPEKILERSWTNQTDLNHQSLKAFEFLFTHPKVSNKEFCYGSYMPIYLVLWSKLQVTTN